MEISACAITAGPPVNQIAATDIHRGWCKMANICRLMARVWDPRLETFDDGRPIRIRPLGGD